MSAKKTAAVIGGGLGGLATALRLSAAGWRAIVCEQTSSPGGKMNCVESSGFRFDTGPSLVTMPWVFEELFEAAGARLQDHVELMQVFPLAEYVFDDGERFVHSPVLSDWLKTIRRLEGGSAAGFLEFMRLGARLFEVSRETFFKRAPFERPDPSALKILRHLPLWNGFAQYHRVVTRHFQDPHLVQMFDRYMTYVGSSPWKTPSTLSVIPFIEYAFGGWHIRGGLYRLIEALAALIRQNGSEVRTGAKVVRIGTQDGRVTGVELSDGSFVAAEVVIMNGDASNAPRLLGRPWTPLPEAERSLSGLVFLFGLRSTLPDRPHHSVFFSADYPREFDQLFRQRRFPDDPTVYVNMPSRTDRSMTPGAGEAMFIMANAPANDGDAWDETMIAAARGRILQRLAKAGWPDFRDDIVFSSVWTPRQMADAYDMPGGAIYGTHSHGWKHAFLRPSNKDRRIRGLYYVGGSTHPGGGTPTVLMSAAIACRLIRENDA